MCIICRGDVIEGDYLDISYCDKIREIPSLYGVKILRCNSCASLKKINNIPGLIYLDCSYCTALTEIFPITTLETLKVFYCPMLKYIPRCLKLQKLCSSHCTIKSIPCLKQLQRLEIILCENINEIPVLPMLEELYCSFSGIKKIPHMEKLTHIISTDCHALTEIKTGNLNFLDCSYCPMLINIPNATKLFCLGCPWLSQNPDNKISQGKKLQRWIKKNFKYFIFRRWIESVEGKEFLYHPNHIGGRIEKAKMGKVFEGL